MGEFGCILFVVGEYWDILLAVGDFEAVLTEVVELISSRPERG